MQALDLILLGRQLVKLGEQVVRGGALPETPNGQALVLRDVFAHPDSPIGAITARTGLPQSYVSESVSALRERGILETEVDVEDRRRTLVRVSAAHRRRTGRRAAVPVDAALAAAIGEREAAAVLPVLDDLARRLVPERPGSIVTALRTGADSDRPGRSG